MKYKFCPECGNKLEKSFKFCPECGLSLIKKDENSLIEKNLELQREQAKKDFEKSVLDVAEAFFAMSKEEREAMVEYVQDKCDEAEQEAQALIHLPDDIH